jgi:predicted DNA-binding protein (MmcQ/YjbR family)
MDIESIRNFCLSLPHTTEGVQWGNDLLFRVGNKMFAVVNLDGSGTNRVAFKCTPEKFAELVEMENIIPAPYMARNHWVSLQTFDALPKSETEYLIRQAYDLVYAKLTKKLRTSLETARL